MPGRPPSSNSFLSSGRGGALDTLEEEAAMIRSRPLWRGGAGVNYNVYLRNNKLQFQSTDTPIIR
jgi:hypothetical protein